MAIVYAFLFGIWFGYWTGQTYRGEGINLGFFLASLSPIVLLLKWHPHFWDGADFDIKIAVTILPLFAGTFVGLLGVRHGLLLLSPPADKTPVRRGEGYRTMSIRYPAESLTMRLRRATYERFPALFKDAPRAQ